MYKALVMTLLRMKHRLEAFCGEISKIDQNLACQSVAISVTSRQH